MVRRNRLWVALGLMMLSLASCNKDESGDPFTLNTKQYNGGAKTYINSGTSKEYTCWQNGDKVLINGTEKTVSVSSGSGDTYEATVDGSDIAESESYVSVYPASNNSISGSAVTIRIPQTTTYTTIGSGAGAGCQVIDAPMAAYSTTRSLSYENLCALTKFQFKAASGTTAKLLSLRIETDKDINGTLTASAIGGSWTTSLTGSGKSRELTFGDGLELSSTEKAVYLYLPEVSDLTSFTVYATVSFGGSVHYFYKTKTGSISLNKGYLYDFGTLTAAQSGTTYTLTDDQSTTYGEKAPDGSAAFPYCINNATEWSTIMAEHATDEGAYFQLTGDFGITSSVATFKGNLEGNGHTITLANCGLIKSATNAIINNITIFGTINISKGIFDNISSSGSWGAVCDLTDNCNITNCNISIDFALSDYSSSICIGGIVGTASNTTTINHCSCENTIEITTLPDVSNIIGGIVGTAKNNTIIMNCKTNDTIKAPSHISGIVGNYSAKQLIANCFSTSKLQTTTSTSNSSVSGICYLLSNINAKLQNCYFNGTLVSSLSNYQAGVCYKFQNGIISHCYHTQYNGSGSVVVQNNINGHSVSNCSTLSNATTITGGAPLVTTLNNNITSLNLSDALQWEVRDGIVTFVEQ